MSTPSEEKDTKDDVSAWKKGEARFTRSANVDGSRLDQANSTSSKRYSEYFDPCQEVADRSLKCLRRNGGDRAMCQDYFE